MANQDISRLCRICLNNSYQYSNIYHGYSADGNNYYEVFNLLYDLQICEGDGLPKYACCDCINIVNQFHEYKVRAKKAEMELISMKRKMDLEKSSKSRKLVSVVKLVIDKNIGVVFSSVEDLSEKGCASEEVGVVDKLQQEVTAPQVDVNNKLVTIEEGPLLVEKCVSREESQGFALPKTIPTRDGKRHAEKKEKVADKDISRYPEERRKTVKRKNLMSSKRKKIHDDVATSVMKEPSESREPLNGRGKRTGEEVKDVLPGSSMNKLGGREREQRREPEGKREGEEEERVKCLHCGEMMESKEKIVEHMRKIYGFGEKRSRKKGNSFTCKVCDKVFNRNHNLVKHMLIHSGEKPYKCSICEFRCTHNADLNKHIRTHTGEKPYNCNVCEKSFSVNSSYHKHMRIHLGDKRYKCDVCDKCFSDNSNYKVHLLIHSDVKPYKCSVCKLRCRQKRDLKVHMRVHSGEKPFQCKLCDCKFSQSGNLVKHIRTHS